jgi:hypothetical protein
VDFNCYRKCADPRDHIYAILGLARQDIAAKIPIDYSLPTAQVFEQFVISMIESSQRLRMSLCNIGAQSLQLPSWVPDFSCAADKLNDLLAQFSSGLSPAIWESCQPHTLKVSGVCVGKIRQADSPLPEGLKDLIHAIRKSEPQDLATGIYNTGETLLEAYINTLRVNLIRDRWPQVITYSSLSQWTQFYLSNVSSAASSLDLDDVSDHRLSNLFQACHGRMFIVLEQGHFGLGPPRAKAGKF